MALVAVGLWLTVPAIKILTDPARRTLTHLWKRPDGTYLFSGHPVGFWTRYRKQVLGSPWNCPHEMCRENARLFREVDSGKATELMLRLHPEVLTSR